MSKDDTYYSNDPNQQLQPLYCPAEKTKQQEEEALAFAFGLSLSGILDDYFPFITPDLFDLDDPDF